MPAVDLAPLMDSPRWKTLEEPIRAELKNVWESKDTSDDDRALMLQKMQGTPQAQPAEPPSTATEWAPGQGPSAWEALKGAVTGTQRLPFQAGAPADQGTDPALLMEKGIKSVVPRPVQSMIEGMASPASVGEGAATLLVPGPMKPIAAGLASGAGEGIRQWGAGEPMDWRKMANEAIWTSVPEVGESAIRHGVKQFARNTPGGILLRHGKAAEEARRVPGKVFQPKPAEQISEAFEEVKRTNLDIDTGDIRGHLTTLSPGKQADTLNLLTRLDTRNQTGGRYAQLYTDVMSGENISRSIGDLQDLRSVLRREVADMDPGEARQMVRDLQGSVDDAIDFGMTHGAMQASTPQIRDTLHTARRDWANRVAADDMGEVIEGKISSTPDLSENKFQLSNFVDEIRRGRSEATKSINRSLDMTPGARDRFNTEMKNISRLFQTVEFSIASDVAGISRFPLVAAVRQGIGQVLLTERGRKWFGEAVTEGRGKLSPNSVAYLVNVARAGFAPGLAENFPIPPAAPDRESGRAPGGRARSTD